MMNSTMMKITMRGIIMKAQGSTPNLIFQNLREEGIPMTSWIYLIQLKVSLSIVTPPPKKKGEVGGHQDAQECFFLVGKLKKGTRKIW